MAECLLDRGAAINITESDGASVFWFACQNGHLREARLLLDRGADTHAKTSVERTALHQGSQLGDTEVVDLLLRRGSAVDAMDKTGMTALHLACMRSRSGVARLLLVAGASVSAEDDSGLSALEWVSSEECDDATRQVLRQHIATPAQTQQARHTSVCANTEESLQRRLNKCGRRRLVRYCSDACRLVD